VAPAREGREGPGAAAVTGGSPSGRSTPWLTWLHLTAPAAFIGYGLFLVSRSVILAVVVGAGVLVLCRFLIRSYRPRSSSDDE
jgi:hypothetical protein